jgi:hypothetical protein
VSVAVDKKNVENGLLSKGFRLSSKDHRYFTYHSRDGKKSQSRTKTSHSPKEKSLGRARIGQMAKQCGLDAAEFMDLIECPMDRDAYENLLEKRGLVYVTGPGGR